MKTINVTIWDEFIHEKEMPEVAALYPNGIHAKIKEFLQTDSNLNIRLASLDEEAQGLPDEILNTTDVLMWWGHCAHDKVDDALVEKIALRVFSGKMGMVFMHSAHESKPFQRIVGSRGTLSWGREQKEVVWNLLPTHPIAKGIPDHFTLESEELYCEPFYIPQPDALIFGSWYEDGYIFRSGLCYYRGAGRVFYFQPGHESRKSFYNPYVQQILHNGVYWVAPQETTFELPVKCPHVFDVPKNDESKYNG